MIVPKRSQLRRMRGEIEFDHVDFYYEDRKPILTDFSLKVKPGETIALVGPTGGGKTTIVNLLCRFYEPKKGVIRINGHDYTEYTMQSLQSRVGIVLQTPHLFSGTIRENIRYGRLDASDADIEQAAKIAGAHEFITSFEKGYRPGRRRRREPALGRTKTAHQSCTRSAGKARDIHHG